MESRQNPPSRGLRGIVQLADIAAGTWTDIISITVPSEAAYGQTVNIQVVVKNLASFGIYIAVTGRYNGVDVFFAPDYAIVGAGASYTFNASFTMPNKNITLAVSSYFWSEPNWILDDTETVKISLKTLPEPEFSGFGISEYITV